MDAMETADLDFTGLAKALLDSETMIDFARRGAALTPFRAELALLMISLHRAEIIGANDRPVDPALQCDACKAALLEGGLYVDGAVLGAGGMWASMCMRCFLEQGKGLGWGIGQLYENDGLGWQCIAGGNPRPKEDD